MTTPRFDGFGHAVDAVPTVGTTAERNARYPTPPTGFKVYNVETGALERWTGSAWAALAFGPSVTGQYDVRFYGATGNGTTDDRAAIVAAQAAAGAGAIYFGANATYRVASDLTISSAVAFAPGAKLSIDGGQVVTITSTIDASPIQIFSGGGTVSFTGNTALLYGYPQWWGATGDGFTNDRSAVQAAITALGDNIGRTLLLTQTAQFALAPSSGAAGLTFGGRLTVRGSGLSSGFKFVPVNNDDVFAGFTTNADNVVFCDFAVTASGAATGKRGFLASVGSISRLVFDFIYFDGFNDYCIARDSGTYDQITNCRFLNTHNTGNTGTAILTTTFWNRARILGCRFQSNDRDIRVNTLGRAIEITGNSFELGGSLVTASAYTHQIQLEGCRGCVITNNYFEGNRTGTTEGVIYLLGSGGVHIDGNNFNGDVEGTTYSRYFVYCDNNTRGIRISNNWMEEVLTGFVRAGHFVLSMDGNRYVDGAAEITTYQGVSGLLSNREWIAIDLPFTFTYDPGNLADGAGETHTESVNGAVLGDLIVVAAPYDLQGLTVTGYVSATDTVAIRVQNESGGAVDLASGTWALKRFPVTF